MISIALTILYIFITGIFIIMSTSVFAEYDKDMKEK